MKILISTLIIITSLQSVAKIEVIGGCQGEACDCLKEAQKKPQPELFETIRAFSVYKEPNIKSPVLGKFEAATKAKLIKQLIAIEEPGHYVVQKVAKAKKTGLKKNDKITLLLNEGEGFSSALLKGKNVSFYFEDVTLKTLKETKVSEWIQLKVENIEGYTPDYPFEGCLE